MAAFFLFVVWRVALVPPFTGHTYSVNRPAFSPEGKALASGNEDGTIILRNANAPTRAKPRGMPLTGYTLSLDSVAFSPNGKTLAVGNPGAPFK